MKASKRQKLVLSTKGFERFKNPIGFEEDLLAKNFPTVQKCLNSIFEFKKESQLSRLLERSSFEKSGDL